MFSYLVTLNEEVLVDFDKIQPVYYKVLLSHFRGLGIQPFPEDSVYIDKYDGLLVQMIIRGPYAIYYSIDEANKTVEVLKITSYP